MAGFGFIMILILIMIFEIGPFSTRYLSALRIPKLIIII